MSMETSYSDRICPDLIGVMLKETTANKTEWFWFSKLVELSDKPRKTVRVHLKHLKDNEVIEYKKGRYRRGQKKLFRLSLSHRWRERLGLEWCQKIHDLVQEALTYLGHGSIEEQLAKSDLSSDISLRKPTRPIIGRLLLEYSAKAYAIPINQSETTVAHRGAKVQNMLLAIRWEHAKPRQVSFKTQIHPSPEIQPPNLRQKLQELDELVFKEVGNK